MDAPGIVCGNNFMMEGAWYCFSDSTGTSTTCPNATETGTVPFNKTTNQMCLAGTTSSSTDTASGNVFGSAIGFQLNNPNTADGGAALTYNATAHNIVGFAITLVGDSDGVPLNINFPPTFVPDKANASVTVPPIKMGTPITYNVRIADAMMPDQTSVVPRVDLTKIQAVEIAIPAGDGVAHPYNICVQKVVPLTTMPAGPPAAGTFAITEKKQFLLEGLGAYGFQNDLTTTGNDMPLMVTIGTDGSIGFTANPTFSTGSTPGAFPSILYGWHLGGDGEFVGTPEGGYTGGKTITGTNALTSVATSWSWSPPSGGTGDAAYDCWFGGAADPNKPTAELMVWLGAFNGVKPLTDSGTSTSVAIGNFGNWNVFTATNKNSQMTTTTSYVAPSMMTTTPAGFDLLPFFKDAAQNRGVSGGSFLLSCAAGFEIDTGTGWTSTSFSMSAK